MHGANEPLMCTFLFFLGLECVQCTTDGLGSNPACGDPFSGTIDSTACSVFANTYCMVRKITFMYESFYF